MEKPRTASRNRSIPGTRVVQVSKRCNSEIVLGRGPVKRDALAGAFLRLRGKRDGFERCPVLFLIRPSA